MSNNSLSKLSLEGSNKYLERKKTFLEWHEMAVNHENQMKCWYFQDNGRNFKISEI